MKRDLVLYGKMLLVTLTPGIVFFLFFLIGEGTAESDWHFIELYLILATYLVIFGIIVIGIRFLFKKIGSWIRKWTKLFLGSNLII